MLPQALPQGNSRSYRPQPSIFKGVQGCRLPAPKCFRRHCQGNSRSYRPQPSVFKGVQGCRLPAPKCFRRPCQGNSRSYSPGRSRLPFARPQMLPQALPRQLSQLQAVCPASYRPQPSVFKGVQGCRLPAPKCFRRPCQGNSRSYRPQPSVLRAFKAAACPPPNASAGLAKATLAATGPSHLFLRVFKAAVCPPPNASAGLAKATLAATGPSHLFLRAFKAAVCPPPNASAGLAKATLAATGPSHLFFKGVQGCRLPAPKCFRRPCQGNSRSYRPQPSVFKGVQGCRLPAPKCFRRPCQGNSRSYRPQPSVFKGVQGCRLPAPKCFRRPCQGNSHLFLRAFKAAVLLPSALLPSFARRPVLYSVFVLRWQPRHQPWHVLFFPSAALIATFASVAATRCTALLMLPRNMGHFQQLLQTWSPLQERCCASHDSKAHAACFTLHTLHLHQPHALPEQSKHTLPPVRARFQAPAENFFSSLRVLQTLHTCVCSHVLQIR